MTLWIVLGAVAGLVIGVPIGVMLISYAVNAAIMRGLGW